MRFLKGVVFSSQTWTRFIRVAPLLASTKHIGLISEHLTCCVHRFFSHYRTSHGFLFLPRTTTLYFLGLYYLGWRIIPCETCSGVLFCCQEVELHTFIYYPGLLDRRHSLVRDSTCTYLAYLQVLLMSFVMRRA